jgi:hypothetical protein
LWCIYANCTQMQCQACLCQDFSVFTLNGTGPTQLCFVLLMMVLLDFPFGILAKTHDRTHLMSIIILAYPWMNSSYNVSHSTLRVMTKEFQQANNLCKVSSSLGCHHLGWMGWHKLVGLRYNGCELLECQPTVCCQVEPYLDMP